MNGTALGRITRRAFVQEISGDLANSEEREYYFTRVAVK